MTSHLVTTVYPSTHLQGAYPAAQSLKSSSPTNSREPHLVVIRLPSNNPLSDDLEALEESYCEACSLDHYQGTFLASCPSCAVIMKFSSPSSPTSPTFDVPSSPLSALIPTFLRRPVTARPSSSLRPRASSLLYFPSSTEPTPLRPAPPPAPPSPPPSLEFGLLDEDPFACHLSPSSPTRTDGFFPLSPRSSFDATRLTSPISFSTRSSGESAEGRNTEAQPNNAHTDIEIQPLHRRGRSLTTISVHPRNQPWQSDRPAFRSRPSLPTLSILAEQNIYVHAPKSSRAKLFPTEPWDTEGSSDNTQPTSVVPFPTSPAPSPVSKSTSPRVSPTRHRKVSPRVSPSRRSGQNSPRGSLSPPGTPSGEAFHASLPTAPSPIEEEEEEDTATSVTTLTATPADAGETHESLTDKNIEPRDYGTIELRVAEVRHDPTRPHAPSGSFEEFHTGFSVYRTSAATMLLPPSPAPSSCLLPSPQQLSPASLPSCNDDEPELEDVSGSETEDMGCPTADTQSEVYFWGSPGGSVLSPASPLSPVSRGRTEQSGNFTPRRLDRNAPRSTPCLNSSSSATPLASPTKRATSHPPFSSRAESKVSPPVNVLSYSDHDYFDNYYLGGDDKSFQDSDGQHPPNDRNGGHGSSPGGSGSGGRGHNDDGDDGNRRKPFSRSEVSTSAPASDNEDDEDSDSDGYGEPEASTKEDTDEDRRKKLLRSAAAARAAKQGGLKAPPVPPVPDHLRLPSPNPSSPPLSNTQSRAPSWASPPPLETRPRALSLATNMSQSAPNRRPPPPPNSSISPAGLTSSVSPPTKYSTGGSLDASSDSDDVPLAQRIPTALTAQKSIRHKVREERARKKTQPVPEKDKRPIANPVQGKPASGVAPDELMMKLLKVQTQSTSPLEKVEKTLPQSLSRKPSQSRTPNPVTLPEPFNTSQYPVPTTNGTQQPSGRPLRPTRSLHRLPSTKIDPTPRRRDQSAGPGTGRPPVVDAAPALPTPKGPLSPALGGSFLNAPPPAQSRSLSREGTRRTSNQHADLAPPRPSLTDSRRPSYEKLNGPNSAPPRPARQHTMDDHFSRSPRPSTAEDQLRRTKTSREPSGRHEKEEEAPSSLSRVKTTTRSPALARVRADSTQQQRVFIGDLQSFEIVEIGSPTTAGDVITMLESQGKLEGSNWMLWELANEFGMERPIRDFERLSDVFSSWNPEARLNALIMKQTPLASALSARAPYSSPTHGGYVNLEVKKGKWSKRWLSLREHSLFIGKKENAKDETLLCSFPSFDAYLVRRITKAPKPFVFAIKSTDNITLFENPSDCVHVFCCDTEAGNIFVEKLLLARSYILQQERNVVYRSQPNVSLQNSKSLSRSATRSAASSRPLVSNLGTPMLPPLGFQQSSGLGLFPEGTLLGK